MNNLVPMRQSAPTTFDRQSLALIKRTVAADCNDVEFDLFISMARSLRLDPLRRQIHAIVYSKDNPKKRKMTLVTAIDGFRTIADRTGNYRPDEDEPSYEYDASLKGPLNPAGIVKATVRVFKHSHGDWHKVTASAFWEEYAPVKDEWVEDRDSGKRKPSGRQTLEGNWSKMPRLMLAKVAEALALRKAWPDDFSAVYSEEELARAHALEVTPTELVNQAAVEERQLKLGGPAIFVDWMDGNGIARVPVGQFADKAMAFLDEYKDDPDTIKAWADLARAPLREFWAHASGDALQIKKRIEELAGAA
jgi:phage recombination protein Bet